MDVKLLCLTVVLLSSPLLTLCDPLYVLSAPNLLRVGSSENVFVEAQDYSGAALNVKIFVKKFSMKTTEILSKSVELTADNKFQILTDIKIPDDKKFFSDDPLEKQYVYLQAQFPSTTLEKIVMVSFQSGYIFVQTDKPIYTPASTVNYRIFSLKPDMKPSSQSRITVEIMNPQGITVSAENLFPLKGMRSGRYTIPDIASSGIWKVVAHFSNTPQKKFTAYFEVKEYVLPVIEVKLKPSKSFFYVRDESLTVDIEAKYLFGQKVNGNAFVVFGVMDGEKKTSIPTSLQNVQIIRSEGTAELTRKMITNTFPDINQLVGRSIYVSVSVLTESGSEMVEAEKRDIQIVTSPYTIHFKTPQFFHPGMPFSVSVYVTNVDQTPAVNVEVEVIDNHGAVRGQTRTNGIAKFAVNTPEGSSTLEIIARTKDPQLSSDQQAVKKMTAQAYQSKGGSNNYLHILIDTVERQINDNLAVYLNTGRSPGVRNQEFTYMILSKGQIVKVDRFKQRGRSLLPLTVLITKDMVPSFRFVAYYHVGSSEVVSDSVWVDVKDKCMGTLQVKAKNKIYTDDRGEKVKLQITGDPGAKVGLVVVDKAVNVLNKNRLTQTQIWDFVEKHDTGCTAGGGRDSMGVFTDAGLMFASSTAGGTNTRTTPACSVLSKRRQRSLGHDDYTDSEEIVSHAQFQESWLWEELDLLDTIGNYDGATSVTDKVIFLKDSITTWQILAVSLSPKLGICVAEPEEMVVFKTFFIDLKMPYSVVRGEQVEIKAIIYNYTPKNLKKVHVEFMETENVCSSASKKGKYRTIISIDKGSSVTVSYVIIPMTLGNHYTEVKASGYDYTDGVRKSLKMVSEGVLTQLHRANVQLNPIKDGEKNLFFNANMPADQLPGTPANTYISITAEEISQTVEQIINGSFMGRLIVQPAGNGETIMIYMTLPLIATHYLDHTNQWDAVGMERRNEAINHIRTGYQRQLTFRKADGSYTTWIHRPSSTWLTAYVLKVFTMASDLVVIHENVICSALKWLVLNKQLPDGSFKEDSTLYYKMMGDEKGQNADVSLAAFVVIAMQESRKICAGLFGSLHESIRKAVSFLEGRLPQLTNPYAVARTSYAMANENKLNKDILMRHSTQSEDGLSWTVPGELYHSLEATAYAVLALVKAKDFDKAGEAVHWMAKQQIHYGGYGTTQVTIMVFQAMAEYHTQMENRQDFTLDVDLSVKGRSRPVRWTFRRDNMHLTRSDKVYINQDFTVTVRGTGTASLSVMTLYYARPVEKPACKAFDLTVTMEKYPESKQGAAETYKLTINFYYKSAKADATMTILDISLPTGFDIEEKDLKEFSTGKGRYIQQYKTNKVLSERGSLILYLDRVLRKELQIISFRMHKMFNVGMLQPAAVTIYEYDSPDTRCTKFYHPERTDGALYKLCEGDLCYCAEENCSYQKKNMVTDEERLNRACGAGVDYVYKVTVVGMDLRKDSDSYSLRVDSVLKDDHDKNVNGNVKLFLAHPRCRDHLGLVKDKSYLIIGRSVLPKLGGSKQYVFEEETWVEYWPTREESTTPKHQERYIGIAGFQNSLFWHGCPE